MNPFTLLSKGLERRAPDEGITRWLNELADDLGYAERTVKGWYYGEAEPNMAAQADLFAYFNDGFRDEVFPSAGARGLSADDIIDEFAALTRRLRGGE